MFGFLSSEVWSGYPEFRIGVSVPQGWRMRRSLVFFRLEQNCCKAEAEHGESHSDGLPKGSLGRFYNDANQVLACWERRTPQHGHDDVYFLSHG